MDLLDVGEVGEVRKLANKSVSEEIPEREKEKSVRKREIKKEEERVEAEGRGEERKRKGKGDIQVKQEVQVAKACGDGSSEVVVWHGAGRCISQSDEEEGGAGRMKREEANKDGKRGDIQVLDCLEVAQVLRELSRDGVVVQDTANVVSTQI